MIAHYCISDVYISLFFFIGALCSCAFFAFLETSVATLKLFTIEELERSVQRYPTLFAALRLHQHRVLTTMVIANSGATVIATTFSTRLLLHCFHTIPHYLELPLSLLFTTTIMLLCGEVIPKHLAQTLGSHLIRYTLWGTNATYHALYPLVTLLTALSERVVRYVARSYRLQEHHSDYVSREELQFMISCMHRTGSLSAIQHTVCIRTFALTKLTAYTIMLPVSETYMPAPTALYISAETSAEQVAQLLAEHPLTEIIVQNSSGIIVGSINAAVFIRLLLTPTSSQHSLDTPHPHGVSLQRTVGTSSEQEENV